MTMVSSKRARMVVAVVLAVAAVPLLSNGGARGVEGPVEVVYVASARNYPDALTGSVLAALSATPLLLVEPTGALPAATVTALDALQPNRIVVFGGPAAVGDDVFAALVPHARSGEVTRLSGADRNATAAAIAAALPARVRDSELLDGLDSTAFLPADAADDYMTVEERDDFLPAAAGDDFLPAAAGDDYLRVEERGDFLPATAGDDYLRVEERDDFLPVGGTAANAAALNGFGHAQLRSITDGLAGAWHDGTDDQQLGIRFASGTYGDASIRLGALPNDRATSDPITLDVLFTTSASVLPCDLALAAQGVHQEPGTTASDDSFAFEAIAFPVHVTSETQVATFTAPPSRSFDAGDGLQIIVARGGPDPWDTCGTNFVSAVTLHY